jgi:hypothetical protein
MGIAWGIEAVYGFKFDRAETIDTWRRFCAAGHCRHFVVPIGEDAVTFALEVDGVSVTERQAPELLAAIRDIQSDCGDTHHSELESFVEGLELFVPDDRGYRRVELESFWYREIGSLCHLLGDLRADGGKLERALHRAASFATKHDLLVAFSWS